MKAVLITEFGLTPQIADVSDPEPGPDGVVVAVRATGLCRSDWHGWLGHDPDIRLPHVPGHEFAGEVVAVGPAVRTVAVGDRVTAPFVCGCGACAQCLSGSAQTCPDQQQPGFSLWGSFAEFVAVPHADFNIVPLPEAIGFDTAAALGCRVATSYRAVRDVGAVGPGQTVLVFGCGGVGLAAVMIAVAAGAAVHAVDVNPEARQRAADLGAMATTAADAAVDLARRVDVVIDALGTSSAIELALAVLVPRGRLVQVGLLPGAITLAMGALIGRELQWLGSHGMPARDYPRLLGEIADGRLRPAELLGATLTLHEAPAALAGLADSTATGVRIIRPHDHAHA